MDYRYLKAFIITAKHKSFSKAAEVLQISQSSVSRQVKLLEESIGSELIIRSSKKVILTNHGNELYLLSRRFDNKLNDLFKENETVSLKVGVLHGLLENWLVPILINFYKKNKKNIEIHILDKNKLKDSIESGLFDVVFNTENIQSDLISSLKLFDEKMVLISKEDVNLKQLQNYRWITYGPLDYIFLISKNPSKYITQVGSITSIINLVKAGVGIAVVPDHSLTKKDHLKIHELKNLPASSIYMTTLNYKVLPSDLKELASHLK